VVVSSSVHDPQTDVASRVAIAKTGAAAPVVEITSDRIAAMVAVLTRPASFGETIAHSFQTKEHDLGALFAVLTIAEARALYRRLSAPTADDALAVAFDRLTRDRRARLLAFLADARRREASRFAS
jgi:hypothetical protein